MVGKTVVDIGPFLTSKIIIQDLFGFSRKPPYKSRFFFFLWGGHMENGGTLGKMVVNLGWRALPAI